MTTASPPSKKPWHSQSHQFCENGKAMRKLDNDDDDDTQVYKRLWVGLTDDEVYKIAFALEGEHWRKIADAIADKLREKNS